MHLIIHYWKDIEILPAGRLRVNMGNIYLKQKKYMQAVKMYRMALDQVPTSHELIRSVKMILVRVTDRFTCCVSCRAKILQNIGLVFVKMGQYSDAVISYEHVMTNSKKPDFKTGGLWLLYHKYIETTK